MLCQNGRINCQKKWDELNFHCRYYWIICLTKVHRQTTHKLAYQSNPLTSTTNSCSLLSDFDIFISSYINNNLWSIPYLAFVIFINNFNNKCFYSSTINTKRLRSYRTVRRPERLKISQALIHQLNKSYQVLIFISDEIMTLNDENQFNEIELDNWYKSSNRGLSLLSSITSFWIIIF